MISYSYGKNYKLSANVDLDISIQVYFPFCMLPAYITIWHTIEPDLYRDCYGIVAAVTINTGQSFSDTISMSWAASSIWRY